MKKMLFFFLGMVFIDPAPTRSTAVTHLDPILVAIICGFTPMAPAVLFWTVGHYIFGDNDGCDL